MIAIMAVTPTPTPAPIAAPLGLLPLLIVPGAFGEMGTEAGLETEVEVVKTFGGVEEEKELLAGLEVVVISMVVRTVPAPREKTADELEQSQPPLP